MTFRIENRGWRPIWVSARETADPARAVFAVERRTEEGSWTLVGRSTAAQRAGTPAWLPVGRQAVPADRIDHGGVREYHYELPPGEYRAVLLANVSGPERQEQTFTLAGAAAPVPRTEDPLVQAPAPGPTAHIDQVRARLRGVVDGSGRTPLFNVNIELPGGETRAQRVTLGGVLFDAWVAEEYNPDRQTLTVNDGQRRMVLQTGEWVNLPVAREALETVPSP